MSKHKLFRITYHTTFEHVGSAFDIGCEIRSLTNKAGFDPLELNGWHIEQDEDINKYTFTGSLELVKEVNAPHSRLALALFFDDFRTPDEINLDNLLIEEIEKPEPVPGAVPTLDEIYEELKAPPGEEADMVSSAGDHDL